MHPKEFAEYWQLRPSEMADLLKRHVTTISRWMQDRENVSEDTRRELDMIHLRWQEWELQHDSLPATHYDLYEIAHLRRSQRSDDSA